MLCEHANAQLVEFASNELSATLRIEVEQHLAGCEICQADFSAIKSMQSMAENWHDETPPLWQPTPAKTSWLNFGHDFLDNFRLWFPTFASATALVLVAVVFVQQSGAPAGLLPNTSTAQHRLPKPTAITSSKPKHHRQHLCKACWTALKNKRASEIQALLTVLKAEMDKRSIATEASMRYIITHQIQGQQEVDELYRQVEALMTQDKLSAGGMQ